LLVGLNDSPRVASNCAWALINLSEQVCTLDFYLQAGEAVGDSYPLSPYFDSIITALMTAAEKPEHAANFRASAYEAIGSFVTTSANDCLPTIEKLTMRAWPSSSDWKRLAKMLLRSSRQVKGAPTSNSKQTSALSLPPLLDEWEVISALSATGSYLV
jgi:hypothetical protein